MGLGASVEPIAREYTPVRSKPFRASDLCQILKLKIKDYRNRIF